MLFPFASLSSYLFGLFNRNISREKTALNMKQFIVFSLILVLIVCILSVFGKTCPQPSCTPPTQTTNTFRNTQCPRVFAPRRLLYHRNPPNKQEYPSVDVLPPTSSNKTSTSQLTSTNPSSTSNSTGWVSNVNAVVDHAFRLILTVLTLFNVTFTWRIHGELSLS